MLDVRLTHLLQAVLLNESRDWGSLACMSSGSPLTSPSTVPLRISTVQPKSHYTKNGMPGVPSMRVIIVKSAPYEYRMGAPLLHVAAPRHRDRPVERTGLQNRRQDICHPNLGANVTGDLRRFFMTVCPMTTGEISAELKYETRS
jgi:hypothetical protein